MNYSTTMHSPLQRLNHVVFRSLYVIIFLAILSGVSTFVFTPKAEVSQFRMNKLHSLTYFRPTQTYYRGYQGPQDVAHFSFDLNVDLKGLFNWNVKQLFLHVIAEYTDDNDQHHEIVVFDKIVKNKFFKNGKRRGNLNIVDKNLKYPLQAEMGQLLGREVTLKLKYDVMPIVGRLFLIDGPSYSFNLPTSYSSRK
eukprot:TRINITY_DN777987_c0_g1_i1.p1 TRINITY_DN777987_c0_g1~~TRINITY_DN777987_c0_g1_i1.p1  ORF type:complete len:195 (-),score=35.92 TRINITY_DN777987_c0_g1_i1:278-862(-)